MVNAGAGCGLVAMSTVLQGVDVIATDKIETLELLQKNVTSFAMAVTAASSSSTAAAQAQSSSSCCECGDITVTALDWCACDGNSISALPQSISLLIACDCVYSSSSVIPLLNLVEQVSDVT